MDAEQIEDDIKDFKKKIVTHQDKLTGNSEWLFVMVLGWWGVTGIGYQLLSLILILIFFIKRIFDLDDEFFPTIKKNIHKKIQLLPNLNERNTLSHKLNTMYKEENGTFVAFKRTWLFMSSGIFLTASVIHMVKISHNYQGSIF